LRKRAFITRSSIVTTLVVVILLATLPSSIRRILQTGDLYLFSRQFFDDMLARLTGAGRLRFLLQPTVAILLGARDGLKDARRGLPPFLWALTFHGEHRRELLRSTFSSVRDLVAIAILLDVLSQYLIFREIHPAAAILLGPVLIGMPYAVSRAFANRISRSKSLRAPSTRVS
jgi:hypothetical protein